MTLRPRVLVDGIADPGQAVEAAELGVDGVVVRVGEGDLPWVGVEAAQVIARAVPPLTFRFAWCQGGIAMPEGFVGAVVEPEDERVPGAAVHLVRVPQIDAAIESVRVAPDAIWVSPSRGRFADSGVLDLPLIERWSRRHRLAIEVADGAGGVEVAMRIARPYALVLGEGVWFRPGIVDMEKLERAMQVVGRVSRALGV